jgi:hypothetical protein
MRPAEHYRQHELVSTAAKGKQRNNFSPGTPGREKIVMDDLDDAVAMMSDIKSLVSEMESSLMDLSQIIKSSYKDDPPF